MNAISKKIIFILVTVVFMLAVLEVSFRVIYSIKYRNAEYLVYGIRNVFKFNVDQFRGYIKLRAPENKGDILYLGFRTAPFPIEKPQDEYRIVALGGSSTYHTQGTYEESWSYILEKLLNERLNDRAYRVINCGVPGQTTYGADRLLTDEIFGWKPDMIVLYTLYNHINFDTPAILKGREEGDLLFRAAKFLFYDRSLLATYLINFAGLHSGLTTQNKMESYRYLLKDIIKKCRDNGVEIIVVKQLIRPADFLRVNSEGCTTDFTRKAPDQYMLFLDIIDEVSAEDHTEMVDFSAYSPVCRDRVDSILMDTQVHLSAYGSELLADTLADKIVSIRRK
ncbi:MAG: hypothetical protein WC515_07705 [Candidatus Omnitrophota bacterium]